ncbi:MAG: AI-2E family transporter [Chitinophagales bacterium]|nr:AI-2E family transporter [Bacteroidota bacterium]MCB9042737.1 AI-2E family transporter [Chitinophagales bacterium]
MNDVQNAARLFITLVVLAFVGVIFYYLGNIVFYFIAAGIFAFFAKPLVNFFTKLKIGKKRLPRSVAAVITILLFYTVFFFLTIILTPLVFKPFYALSQIDFGKSLAFINPFWEKVISKMADFGIFISEKDPLTVILDNLKGYFNIEKVGDLFGSLFGILQNTASVLIAVFSITFIAFFFMSDDSLSYKMVNALIPKSAEVKLDKVLSSSKELMRRYILGILLQIAIDSAFVTILLLILGIENALLIGLICGISNIIPYVGPIIGGVMSVILSISNQVDADVQTVVFPIIVKVIIVVALMQFLDNWFVQPYIFSNSVNAHPLEIFTVILVAGSLSGIVGMVLAIPIYTILRLVLKEFLSEFKVVQKLTENIK